MKDADTASRKDGEGNKLEGTSRFPGYLIAAVLLLSITLAVFWQVRNHEFVGLDDDHYVAENATVRKGLTIEGLEWAFRTTTAANWHPVTWISHMLDISLFGLNPGAHHLTSVAIHAANAVLLFLLLTGMTGRIWAGAFTAALFAVHPLHVESVAWISERKDVLSTLFGFLAILEYLRYVRRPAAGSYLKMILFFGLGLMTKPMLVTLPFVLVLLDLWPLRRFGLPPPGPGVHPSSTGGDTPRPLLFLLREKAPLFVLSAASSAITYIVQETSGAVIPGETLPIGIRMENALISYAAYLGKTIWPAGLSAYYPYPLGGIPLFEVAAAVLLLILISAFAVWQVRQRPYITIGWFWFLGTLVPVIGMVQVGGQAMADRYTYLPLVGIFIPISWGIPDLLSRFPHRERILAVLGGGSIVILSILTWFQVGHWRTTETLFEHALAVTENNALAHSNLGAYLAKGGRTDEAIPHFLEALRIEPADSVSHNNLGVILDEAGDPVRAQAHFREAIRHDPGFALAHANLGYTLFKSGNYPEAIDPLIRAIELNPDDAKAHEHLGNALEMRGNLREASDHYRMAVRLREDNAEAGTRLALLLMKMGEFEEAEELYRKLLRKRPEDTQARFNLGVSLFSLGRIEEAVSEYRRVVKKRSDDPKIHVNLGMALAARGNLPEAVSEYREALRLKPDDLKAHNGIGVALAQMGNLEEAFLHFRRVLRVHPNDATAHFNLAMALNLAGKRGDAVRHFRIVLRVDPQNREAARQLELTLGRSQSTIGE